MSMGSTMMQQAELRRKADVAKSRPSSISKIQIAVTGAASLIPGSRALPACKLDLDTLFTRARGVNFNVAKCYRTCNRNVKTFVIGDVGQPRLSVFRHGPYVRVIIHGPATKFEEAYSITLTDCDDSNCPLFKTVIQAWSSPSLRFAKALLNLREEFNTNKLYYLLVKHDKDRQYQPNVFNWLSRSGPRRPEGFEKPEETYKPQEPQEPQFFQLGY